MTKKSKSYVSANPSEWLGLNKDEAIIVKLKVGLSLAAKQRRKEIGWTQQELADALGTFQSRIAKFERGLPDFSIEFMIRAMLAMECSFTDIQNKMRDISGGGDEHRTHSLIRTFFVSEKARQQATALLACNPEILIHWRAVLESAEDLNATS